MDVILREDVEKLGLKGEVVSVARGYARNFLLPRQLAELATPAKVAELQKREALRQRHEANTVEQAEQIADVLRKTVLRFEVQAGPTGTLFGSVTPTNIAEELWRTRKVRVDRKKIGIDTIKRIGRYEVPIEVFQDVSVAVKTMVVPEGGELPPEEELAAMEAAEAAANAPAEAPPAPEVEYLDEPDELAPSPAEAAEQVPDDAFDHAVDAAVVADEPAASEPEASEPDSE